MYEYEIEKIKSLVDSEVLGNLAECNAIIAGGAITSVFTNKDVNDVDVYFRSPQMLVKFLCRVYDGSWDLMVMGQTEKSITLKDRHTENKVQLISFDYHKDVQSIFNLFDFTVNMGALELSLDEDEEVLANLVLHDDFLKDNSQRRLQVNTNTKYPLISALRVNKYLDRGYTISKSQYLRLLLAINTLDISCWDELLAQLGGMYGERVEDIFDTSKEFDIQDAIEQLGCFEPRKGFNPNVSDLSLQGVIAAVLEGQDYRKPVEGLWFAREFTSPTKQVDEDGLSTGTLSIERGEHLDLLISESFSYLLVDPTKEQLGRATKCIYTGGIRVDPGVKVVKVFYDYEDILLEYQVGTSKNPDALF